MKYFILFLLLLPATVFAENLIKYDADDLVVPNRVIQYKKDGDQSAYLVDPNDYGTAITGYLVDVDLSAVSGVAVKYWKVSGSDVLEMSVVEKSAVDTEESDAIAAAEAARISLFDDTIYTAKTSDAVLPKIDAQIDAISNLADAKNFLKKLVRYLLNK